MISLAGFTFSVLSPWLLLLSLPATALLVYAYLKRGRGKRVVVATLLLLNKLEQRAFSRSTFKPPFRFYLELLVLLLLVLGAAEFFKLDRPKSVAILIDNSFSMASSGPASTDRTLLKEAVSKASSFITQLPGSSEINLYTTSPELKKLKGSSLSSDQAIRAMREIQIAFAADNLQTAALRVISEEAYDIFHVFSDKVYLKQASESSENSDFLYTQIGGLKTAGAYQNIAITDIALQSNEQSKFANLKAEISAFTSVALEAQIELKQFILSSSGVKTLNLSESKIALKAGDQKSITFTALPQNGYFKVQVIPLSPKPVASLNRITFDDEAFLGSRAKSSEITLVGQLSSKALGLDQIDSIKFKHQNIGAFLDEAEKGVKNNSPVLFHRYYPPFEVERDAIFVLPASGSSPFTQSEAVKNIELSSWLQSHPINNYINFPSLRLQQIVPLQNAPWAKELLSTSEGVAAFVGSVSGWKRAIFSFELFPYTGKNAPVISILTLNALKWLTEASFSSGYASIKELPANKSLLDIIAQTEAKNLNDMLPPERPGLYRINDTDKTVQAVNYFDVEEFDLRESQPFNFSPPVREARERSQISLARQLAILILALLFLDMFLQSGVINIFKKLLRRRQANEA